MYRGYVDEITAEGVRGWALEDADLKRAISVDLIVDGVQYSSPRADMLRQDLQSEFGYGHHAFAFNFRPPLSLVREHHVVIRFSGSDQIVTNGERTLPGPQFDPQRLLQPILVTAPGRAGSTVLVQRFAAHPAVSVANLYPFETELLKYYGHAFGIMTAPGDHEYSGKPEHFVQNHRFLGANPYYVRSFSRAFRNPARFEAFYSSTVARELTPALRGIINKFYISLAEDQNKPNAVHFAEKCQLAGMARWLARGLFDNVHEVVLVRDPRDTLCSYSAFWSQPRAEAMRLLREAGEALLRIHVEERADTLLVRYEDMVEREAETLRRISAFIGIRDFGATDAQAESELFRVHGTSKSPEASIGRWKRELAIEEVKASIEAFGPFLEAFGYEV